MCSCRKFNETHCSQLSIVGGILSGELVIVFINAERRIDEQYGSVAFRLFDLFHMQDVTHWPSVFLPNRHM